MVKDKGRKGSGGGLRRWGGLVLTLVVLALGATLPAGTAGGDEIPENRYYLLRDYLPQYDVAKYYLVAYVPLNISSHKVFLNEEVPSFTFTHHILGRKADTVLVPRINLWVNSGDTAGKTIEAVMRFDSANDGNFEARYRFGPYETNLTDSDELVTLDPASVVGEPLDMTGENGGLFEFEVRRTDDLGGSLILYCGAFSKPSWVETPYADPASVIVDDGEDDGGDRVANANFLYVAVAAVGVLLGVWILSRWRKAGLPVIDEPKERPRKSSTGGKKKKGTSARRDRPGGKRRKARSGGKRRKRKTRDTGEAKGAGGEDEG